MTERERIITRKETSVEEKYEMEEGRWEIAMEQIECENRGGMINEKS